MRMLLVSMIALSLVPAWGQDPDRAEMSVGSYLPAFDVVDVTGPNKGKQLCYV